jgi:NAD(P)-dependent dehydrogenase (short-subunit alcohol dehydrogenase family)
MGPCLLVQVPNFGVYSASKAAVDSITRVSAAELAADKIQVFSVNPFLFESEMVDRSVGPGNGGALAAKLNISGKIGKGSDLGKFLVDLIRGSLASKYASGSSIAVDFGNANWLLSDAVAASAAKAAKAAKAASAQ